MQFRCTSRVHLGVTLAHISRSSRAHLGEISRDLGDQDRDARQAKPKGKDSVLNDPIMGDLKSRFGGRHRETTFM